MSQSAQLEVLVKKHFHSATRDFTLDVMFTLAREIVVIFGASGAGKTTILECISGLLQPDAGSITLGERKLCDSAGKQNVSSRERRIGYVFQSLALFPHLTGRQNVGFGLGSLTAREREERVDEMLASFRAEHAADRFPDQMSGGERQRIALARSLVMRPDALLLDEPMTALDYETKAAILHDLREWHTRHQIPVLYVTHAIDEVFAIADRVIKLADGRIVAEGKPHEVLGAERQRLLQELQSVSR